MKVYWSDKNSILPPLNCQFHLYPFSQSEKISTSQQVRILPAPTSAKIIQRSFFPEKKMWMQLVEKAKQWILQHRIDKVVLARKLTLKLDHAPDPFAITAALRKKAIGSYVFCAQLGSIAFLGASPETLFCRNQHLITTDAIAGTRKRGLTPKDDERLKNELMYSTKDLHEFSFIPTFLQKRLSPFCIAPLTFSPITVLQTPNVQHLHRQGIGTLKENVSDEMLIQSLHPTPALCGEPQQSAFSFIQENEPFERGYYGGIIGWSTPNASKWAVGIRTCLLEKNQAHLFSGTGIVASSDAEQEWEELNQKVKLYESILAD